MLATMRRVASRLARVFGSWKISQTPGVLFSGPTSTAGVSVTTDDALSLSAVFAAVNLISGVIGSLPLSVYRKWGRAREQATTHPAWRLLHLSPNPEMTPASFVQAMEWNRLLGGNAYASVQWAGNGKPIALWPVEFWRVKHRRREDGSLYFEIDGKDQVEPEDMLHVPQVTADGVTGRSFLEWAIESLGLGIATQQFAASYFGNGARPGGLLKHPGNPPKPQRDEFRRSWEERHGGAPNANKTGVLFGGWEYVPDAFNAEQSQLVEQRRFTTEEVARWLNIPPHLLRDLNRATFCLPAGQTVLTEDGPKPIEMIRAGELVWSRGFDGMRLARVSRAGCTGSDPILTIRTTNRTLRCNAKHPILCRRKVLTPRPVGVLGGVITAEGNFSVSWETRYVPAGELTVGDTIVTLDRLPDSGSLEACPTRLPTIGFMEFCGLLLGDGNIIRNEEYGSAYVTIARAKHASYMDYYREVIVAEFNDMRGHPVRLQEGDRQTRFSSMAAVEELSVLGFRGNARTKRVPGWVFRLPETHRLAFLRGFLDADGSCDKKGRLSFSSCSGTMLGQIRDLCIGCGVPVTNLRLQEGVTTLPNGERKEFSQYTFTCSDPASNRRIGSRTPGYVARMEAGVPFGRKDRKYPRHGGDIEERGLSVARIASIDVGSVEPVYDLTVEETHSFVAEGVIVHNSNIEQQNIDFLIYSLTPVLVKHEQEYNRKLLSPPETYAKFGVKGLLRGDSTARAAFYSQMIQIGIFSVNECREWEEESPVDGGDVHFFPLNMAPLPSVAFPPPVVPETPPPQSTSMPGTTPAPVAEVQPALARLLLEQTLERLWKVEQTAILRAVEKPTKFPDWMEEFYANHESKLAEALAFVVPTCIPQGASPLTYATFWCADSTLALGGLCESETPATFAGAVKAWLDGQQGRAKEKALWMLGER